MTLIESKSFEFGEERPAKKHSGIIDDLDLAQTESDFYRMTFVRDPYSELRFQRK